MTIEFICIIRLQEELSERKDGVLGVLGDGVCARKRMPDNCFLHSALHLKISKEKRSELPRVRRYCVRAF